MKKLLLGICVTVACWTTNVGAMYCNKEYIVFWDEHDKSELNRRRYFNRLEELYVKRDMLTDDIREKRFPRLRRLYVHGETGQDGLYFEELENFYDKNYNGQTLPEFITDTFKSVEHLTIDRVYFPTLPNWFVKFKNLRHLEINYLEFQLPNTIGSCTNLESLVLTCAGKSLPDSIGNLKNLRYLEIGEGDRRLSPFKIGGRRKVREFYYSNTAPLAELVSVPESVGNLQNLERLAIHSAFLKSLPESIGNLKNLKWLNLSDCRSLNSLPRSIENLENLESVNIGKGLSIARFVKSGRFEQMEAIDLSGKGIDSVPCDIVNAKQLKELNLSNNKLTRIPLFIEGLTMLERLDLRNNPDLTDLPSVLWKMPALREIMVDEKLENSIFQPCFIVNLVLMKKNRTKLSDQQLEEMVRFRINGIPFRRGDLN